MCIKQIMPKLFILGTLSLALSSGATQADELNVMNSGGFTAAYKALQPKYEAASGNTLTTAWGPSMGKAPEAIPNRLARGEPAVPSRTLAQWRSLSRC